MSRKIVIDCSVTSLFSGGDGEGRQGPPIRLRQVQPHSEGGAALAWIFACSLLIASVIVLLHQLSILRENQVPEPGLEELAFIPQGLLLFLKHLYALL